MSKFSLPADQIAYYLGGEIEGDGSIILTGLAAADRALAGDLTFAENEVHFEVARQSAASAILVAGTFSSPVQTLIRVSNVRIAIARLWKWLYPPEPLTPGVHPSAVIASDASIDPSAFIGPNCVVSSGVIIGAKVVLLGGNFIGRDCRLGDGAYLHPNVVLYAQTQLGQRVTVHAGTVIGSDGYGYVLDEGRHRQMPQLGSVIIGDDVEIGANCAIDRGALGPTTIAHGTKIDNLVHIAHNVAMGQHCLIMGQAGFAGSTQLGDYCVIASQAGIAGHLKLGAQSMVGAKSGVMRDVPAGQAVVGIPAWPDKETKRQVIALARLPELLQRVRELEKQLGAQAPKGSGS